MATHRPDVSDRSSMFRSDPVVQRGLRTAKRADRIAFGAPDLVGLQLRAAKRLARMSGVSISVTTLEMHAGPRDRVVAQFPDAGGPVRRGSQIHVDVVAEPAEAEITSAELLTAER